MCAGGAPDGIAPQTLQAERDRREAAERELKVLRSEIDGRISSLEQQISACGGVMSS